MSRKHTYSRYACLLAGSLIFGSADVLVAQDDWESINSKEMIRRSKYIGVGTLSHFGRYDDGSVRGRFKFSQQIYSGIGDTKKMDVKIAPKTIPGKAQYWKIGSRGVWFILKSGDKYTAVNHPGCRLDSTKAREVSNDVYAWLNEEYEEAEEDAEEANGDEESSDSSDDDGGSDDDSTESGGSDSSDSSDSSESVSAYSRMTEAAEAASKVPFQNKAAQSSRLYQQVMSMLKIAGVKSPFPADLKNPAQQQQLFSQFQKMLGPAGNKLGSFVGGKGGGPQLQMAQNGIGQIGNQLIKSTMGSKNPAQSLGKMKGIDLPIGDMIGGGKGPGGMPGPGAAAGGSPRISLPVDQLKNIPTGGSRKSMLNAGMGKLGGGGGMPKMGGGMPGPGGKSGGGGPPFGGGGGPGGGRGPGGPGGGGGGPRGPGR